VERTPDFDAARAAVAARGLVADASAHLTEAIATRLPFESLGPYKTVLKRFFSHRDWTAEDDAELAAIVGPAGDAGPWGVRLDEDLVLTHGPSPEGYRMSVTGAAAPRSIFDRVFAGPVVPEPTPHPRKVKFTFGGTPAVGAWHRRGEPIDDERAARLLSEPDVTDVMVAGTFVTVGLDAGSSWEERLDDVLVLVTELFPAVQAAPAVLTREELMREGGKAAARGAELHLLDPDDPAGRSALVEALDGGSVLERRVAVAILSESADEQTSTAAIERGTRDSSLAVRRTAIDAAADLEDERMRAVFEEALSSADPWTRWRAVRAIGDIGAGGSSNLVAALAGDPDFQVRFEVARLLGTG
jgi:HEAT repeat protein